MDAPNWKKPEYKVWDHMIQRCTNPNVWNYKRYGGRGISVCLLWRRSFQAFLRDVGKRPSKRYTLERTDNRKGYAPGNVRWATHREQANNRANNRVVKYRGETLTIAELSRKTGVKYCTLFCRLRAGFSVDQAVKTPIDGCKKRYLVRGALMGLPELAKLYRIEYATLRYRVVEKGIPIEKALKMRLWKRG